MTPKKTNFHEVLIIGGGAAGITVASQLKSLVPNLDLAIVEPSTDHDYQPGWTLVGGGVFTPEQTVRPQKTCLPPATIWIQDTVVELEPEQNWVLTAEGQKISYNFLVVCPGIQINWHLIEGLETALGRQGVTSNYAKKFAPYTWELIDKFSGGTAIFTHPNTAIKCGGAPQKIMYMADDIFKGKSGVGTQTEILFCSADNKLFGVPEYARVLEQVVERRGIQVKFQHNLKAIDGDRRQAVFEQVTDQETKTVSLSYDLIHVTPPMSAPDFVQNSSLAQQPGGWVEVDKETLQHLRYSNVFGLGDASSLPTSKTAAAVRGQAPVVVHNLLAQRRGEALTARYDGYTCCPVITGYNSTLLAEFNYEKKPLSSFYLDPTKERYSMWLVKCYLLPWLYWHRMLKGAPFEKELFSRWQSQLGGRKVVNSLLPRTSITL